MTTTILPRATTPTGATRLAATPRTPTPPRARGPAAPPLAPTPPRATPAPTSLAATALLLIACAAPLTAQNRGRQGAEPFQREAVSLRGVLGGVALTARDSATQAVVARLDFDSYRSLVEGLTQFGDRRQGTDRNARAVDWIEARLREWGYQTERVHYQYTPRGSDTPEPREQVFATKWGTTVPGEMYILGAHMDGIGNGEAANDDGSGTALVLEIARALAGPDVRTARTVRFALWNNEETGLNGAEAYVEQRAHLQGVEDPPGSGRYPEPRWLGMIQHDMMMWDHGNPPTFAQALDADVDIEFQLDSERPDASAALALKLLNANRKFAGHYPAVMSNAMSNTDSRPFQDHTAAVSLRENRRLYETGNGANPHWHRPTDLFTTFREEDFRLGFNAAQTTLGAVAELVDARVVGR